MNKSEQLDGMMYFAHRLQEATFHYTIDIYKAPIYNTNQLAYEYLLVHEKVKNKQLNDSYLEDIKKEFLYSLEHDIVLKEYWGDDNIELAKNQIYSSNQNNIDKLMHYLYHIWNNGVYFNWCKEYIKIIISSPKEKKKIERSIKILLPELFAYGYSNECIYKRVKYYFFEKKKSLSSINAFLDSFDVEKKEYKVYLAINKDILQFKEILNNKLRVNFDDDGNFSKLNHRADDIIISIDTIEALDEYSAVEKFKSILNIFMLFYIALDNKNDIDINDVAMTFQGKELCYVHHNNSSVKAIERFSSEEAAKYAEQTLNDLLTIFGITPNTLFSLMQIFEKHNSAILDDNIENSFLNLWSIFEMFSNNIENGNKIEKIKKTVLIIITNNHLKRIVSDLTKNLISILGKDDFKSLLDKTDIEDKTDTYKLSCIIFLDEYSQIREEIYSKITNPNIRSRISQLNELGGNSKYLYKYTEQYKTRVSWHITRMYRIRNSIIHSGDSDNKIEHICNHLHAYVDILIDEMVNRLTCGMQLSSVDDVITFNQFRCDELQKVLNQDKRIDKEMISYILK